MNAGNNDDTESTREACERAYNSLRDTLMAFVKKDLSETKIRTIKDIPGDLELNEA